MKREFMITVGAAATLAVALAAPASASNTKVVIDGKDQNVNGQVVCSSAAGKVNIAISGSGASGATAGIGAVLTTASPPVVTSVGLGNINGVTLGVGGTSGKAQATKDGNTYKITGTASGVDMKNPTAPVNKSFELDVTCP